MDRSWIIVVAGFLVMVLMGLGVLSVRNSCVRSENLITAKYEDNQNVYDSYFKKLKETIQVNEIYTEDLRKVYGDAMRGRYGERGSQAVFQFIQERNPDVDARLYLKVQQVIESGRDDFQRSQTELLDIVRVYRNDLDTFPGGTLAGFMGFPRKFTRDELEKKYGKPVTSETTRQMFEKGTGDPIKLR